MNKDEQDLLGTKPYAETIVKTIEDFFDKKGVIESNLNILISSKWGTGKTFVINQIESFLENKKINTFKFNPWKYSQSQISIKRKFLKELHDKFGGDVNLDVLYEGIEVGKQRSLSKEIAYISKSILRFAIYTAIPTFILYGIIWIIKQKNEEFLKNFSISINTIFSKNIDLINKPFEISLVVGLLTALIPGIKLITGNLLIKSKKSEIDSIEQFEDIFSKIIGQNKHAFLISLLEKFQQIKLSIKSFLKWDVFFLDWIDPISTKIKNNFRKYIQKFISKIIIRTKELLEQILKTKFFSYPIVIWIKDNLIKFTKFNFKIIKAIKIFVFKIFETNHNALYQKKFPKVVIIIDDLDRCEEAEVKNILDSLLTFFEQPNCVYVVTADHTVIERYISNQIKFKNLKGKISKNIENDSTAKEYLHKIFHINFLLPQPPKPNFENYLNQISALAKIKKDEKEISDLAYKFFKRNPRAIKRFYSKIEFSLKIAESLSHTEDQDKIEIAKTIISNPGLIAKSIALEMITPKFYSVLIKEPQIAQDIDVDGTINRNKKYLDRTIDELSKEQNIDMEEISIGEQIIAHPPFVKEKLNLSYENLFNFSSSTYSSISDTYDWEIIQQDMEKGADIYEKIYYGTTDRGRSNLWQKSVEKYEELKKTSQDNHLFVNEMINILSASNNKGDESNVIKDHADFLIGIIDIEPKESFTNISYGKIFALYANDPEKEKTMISRIFTNANFLKNETIIPIFSTLEIDTTKNNIQISDNLKKIILQFKNTYQGVFGRDSEFTDIPIKILENNYQVQDEDTIPISLRGNFLNALIISFIQSNNAEELKNLLGSLKQDPYKVLIPHVQLPIWNKLIEFSSNNEILLQEIFNTDIFLPNALRELSNQNNDWFQNQANKNITDTAITNQFSTIPSSREEFNEGQQIAFSMIQNMVRTAITNSDTLNLTRIKNLWTTLFSYMNQDEKDNLVIYTEEKIKKCDDKSKVDNVIKIIRELKIDLINPVVLTKSYLQNSKIKKSQKQILAVQPKS